MYNPPPLNPNSNFVPLNNGFGIQPINNINTPYGGDVHDTFKVDPMGNIHNGHTTVRIPGGQSIQMPW